MRSNVVPAVGKILFRLRSWTPIPLVIWILVHANPSIRSFLYAIPAILAGLLVRFWSVTWIGPESRTRSDTPPAVRISGGPYRLLRHPLYVGNGILSAGLVAMSGAGRPWLTILFPFLWLAQYGPVIAWEERQLDGVPRDSRDRPGFSGNEAWQSESRTRQSVIAFACAVLVSRVVRHIRSRKHA
jgi:protein-S-isoprenylcysteine O-methyltransferase Ste14